jgi:hypothetical protein
MNPGLVLRGVALVAAIALGRLSWTSRGGRRVAAAVGTLVAIAVFAAGSVLAVR